MTVIEKTVAHGARVHRMRWQANLLALWGLCGNATCRRARCCRGDVRDCLARLAPLVPEDARAGVEALDQGRALGLPFDSVQDQAPDEIDAVLAWQELVMEARR